MVEILYKDEVYQIIGACFDVHSTLGHGFLEAVYSEALAIELSKKGVPFEMNKELNIQYKDRVLHKRYYADLVVFEKIIIELKAIETLAPEHTAQVLNYLKATKMRLGLLINFGASKLQYERIIL
jgi:GxxExxY protein